VWFALAYWLAASGALVNGPGEQPIAVALTVFVPILLFSGGPAQSFMAQARRFHAARVSYRLERMGFIGLGFIMGYAQGLLPGGFAWPAGLGDIAMAVTAPFVAARVAADDRFRFGQQFWPGTCSASPTSYSPSFSARSTTGRASGPPSARP
jgi:hypothetical protein